MLPAKRRKAPADEDDWQVDWEGHRRRQLTAAMEVSPARRLEWLEEMIRFAHRVGALGVGGSRSPNGGNG